MLNLTKLQLIKMLILYIFLILAAVFCYNSKRIVGTPRKRPFRCFDETLNKPFVEDTVTPSQLYLLSVYFPIALIIACEFFITLNERKTFKNSPWILRYVVKCCLILTLFGIGLAVERSLKNIVKIKMARLRPNFLTVCDPINNNGLKCSDLIGEAIMMDYTCSSIDYPNWALKTAFMSFPSGHTSLTSYAMVFLACYLHLLFAKLYKTKSSSSIAPLIGQILCLLMIPYVGMSRILDFRHHWTDVFAGCALGISVALAISWYLKIQLQNINTWLEDVNCESKELENTDIICANTNENLQDKHQNCIVEVGEESSRVKDIN